MDNGRPKAPGCFAPVFFSTLGAIIVYFYSVFHTLVLLIVGLVFLALGVIPYLMQFREYRREVTELRAEKQSPPAMPMEENSVEPITEKPRVDFDCAFIFVDDVDLNNDELDGGQPRQAILQHLFYSTEYRSGKVDYRFKPQLIRYTHDGKPAIKVMVNRNIVGIVPSDDCELLYSVWDRIYGMDTISIDRNGMGWDEYKSLGTTLKEMRDEDKAAILAPAMYGASFFVRYRLPDESSDVE